MKRINNGLKCIYGDTFDQKIKYNIQLLFFIQKYYF